MRADELSYAVRPRALAVVLGQLAAVLAGLTCVPLLVALLLGDTAFAGRCGAVVLLLTAAAVAARQLPRPRELQANEALVASVLSFVLAPLLMTWPLAGAGLAPGDAFFEAVSAVTTTGLSVVADVAGQSPALVFTKAWMQWYGGLGFVVMSVALIVRPGPLARQLAIAGGDENDLTGSARAHGRTLLGVYVVLTLSGVALVMATGLGFFASLVHVLASVSTGGFGMRADSLATIGAWPTQLAILLVCCAGAVPLVAYHRGWRRGLRSFAADVQVRALAFAIVALGATMVAVLVLVDGFAPAAALRHGAFQVLSAQSTTGFSTLDLAALSDAAKLVLVVAMFVGGGAGSTAGGIKLLRAVGAVRILRGIVSSAGLPPHAVDADVEVGGQRLGGDEASQLLLVVLLFVAVVVASTAAFVVSGFAPIDALFEVVSATATVGLSTGITSATLSGGLKAVLCAAMLFGRVEIMAALVVLYPRTWIGLRREG